MNELSEKSHIKSHIIQKVLLISVIVPIYNSAAFLEQALQSLCDQSHKNLANFAA